ncbi:MAG: Holliday junction branch migration protein RuvA [Candidatus Eisenbacteria bacterium]|uniref:Holliday junction branch migration complex subunit RuvA n=1 Tax=Eiseniibacteriota bacterium TaxID=2212470 RepID=A0A938BML2_UNCEI|nr:Holliday junction branch migration protein RuvA [Candidatus Eisenbacteria bacterium]
MIERVRGRLVGVDAEGLVVELGGLSLRLLVPRGVLADMASLSEGTGAPPAVSLATHMLVRPESWQLFGFAGEEQRDLFRTLLGVTGIGPRLALSLLSHLSREEIAAAAEARDARAFQRVPGVGKRTAERIAVELAGKLAPAGPGPAPGGRRSVGEDAIDALLALGVAPAEASALVRAALRADPQPAETGDLVAAALRVRRARG